MKLNNGILFAAIVAQSASFSLCAEELNTNHQSEHEIPQVHSFHWSRDMAASHQLSRQTPSASPNLIYHNGNVMPSVTIQPLFWGSSWKTYSGDKVAGMNTFYGGYGNSSYNLLVSQYHDNSVPPKVPGMNIHAKLAIADFTAASAQTSQLINEVCKVLTADSSLPRDGSLYVPVYTDIARGHTGYCAYHSAGTCSVTNGSSKTTVAVEFGFFFNLDNDSGCNPQSTVANQSEGLAAIANVTAHELSELLTDPATFYSTPPTVGNAAFAGWIDSAGQEIGDKCAWHFSKASVNVGGVQWKLQDEWDNVSSSCKISAN